MCVWGKSHGLEIECQGGVVWDVKMTNGKLVDIARS
jgi:hypothetical protein